MQSWCGQVVLGPTWGVFSGVGGRTPAHRHLAFKWVVGLEAPVRVQRAGGDERAWLRLVRPNEAHVVDSGSAKLALLYLEPGAVLEPSTAFAPASLEALRLSLTRGPESVAGWMSEHLQPQTLDPRLERATRHLRAGLPLDQVRESTGLSASRLSHLFSEKLHAPPARYRGWYRLRSSLALLGAGASVTEAAHEVGFSDSAHLARSFIETLGISATTFRDSDVWSAPSGSADSSSDDSAKSAPR